MHGHVSIYSNFNILILFKSTVFWAFDIEGVGLTAILTTIGIPFDIPPNIPPDDLYLFFISPFFVT